MSVFFPFDNSYARLPGHFFAHTTPTPVLSPRLIRLNEGLALELGLDPASLRSDEGVEILAGNRVPGNAVPIATAYAGHQFGGFVPQLGDGRAILLGEVIDTSGRRRDIQLKGAGRTAYSRGGDGRAALGPVLREYVVSEAMAALGIRSTRALAAIASDDRVMREQPLPGAVLTRVAASHIRVGTFQFFASRGDYDGVRVLADHVIARHYPAAAHAQQPYLALLDAVVEAQAALIADWLLIGFIHGVMNTDNMSIAGETIDYGPCAFMDEYNPGIVFSSIDRGGRYAYIQQPGIGEWNLARLAECLLPLISEDADRAVADAMAVLEKYSARFSRVYQAGLRAKIGLATERDGDGGLALDLLRIMADNGSDFTNTFRALCDAAAGGDESVRGMFIDAAAIDGWLRRWRSRLDEEGAADAERADRMRRVNPAFVPRNHRVEAVIRAAVDRDDYAPFEELITVLSRPFDDQPAFRHYMDPPQEHERVLKTFCGT